MVDFCSDGGRFLVFLRLIFVGVGKSWDFGREKRRWRNAARSAEEGWVLHLVLLAVFVLLFARFESVLLGFVGWSRLVRSV